MAAKSEFELIFEKEIPELKGLVRFYRHIRTGAELLSIINEEDNKVFGICFRTPPPDSSGVDISRNTRSFAVQGNTR